MKKILISIVFILMFSSNSLANMIIDQLKEGCKSYLIKINKTDNPFEALDSESSYTTFSYINGLTTGMIFLGDKSLTKSYTITEVMDYSCKKALYHNDKDISFHSKIRLAVYDFILTKR